MRALFFSVLSVFMLGCKQGKDWNIEPVDKSRVDWSGSWPNGTGKLKLISHAWKIYDEGGGKCSWAFRAKLVYPQNSNDDSSMVDQKEKYGFGGDDLFVIPLNSITYRVYDEDDFIIDSVAVEGKSVLYKDSTIVQWKQGISKEEAHKIKRGRLGIKGLLASEWVKTES